MNVKSLLRGIRSAASIKASVLSGFRKPPSPLFMVWEATYRCNLHCGNCYLDKFRDNDAALLGTDEIKKIIDEAARLGLFCLVISGGEPLLREDIFDIRAYAASLGLYVSLTTNGTLIGEANAAQISRFDHITVSVDSNHGMSYIETVAGKKSYNEHIEHVIRELGTMSSRLSINVQTVIDADNWMYLLDFNRYFRERNIDTVFQLGYGSDFEIERIRWDDMVECLEFKNKKLGWIHKKMLRLFPLISTGGFSSPCLALTSNFVVSPAGDLLPCNYKRNKIVNLKNGAALSSEWKNLEKSRKIYSSDKRGCTCANTCFLPPAMILS